MSVFKELLTAEGRRAWALAFLAGGGIVMTLYAAAALWLVKTNVTYVLYLGLAAHVSILIVLTGFAGLLVKRMISAKVLGGEFQTTDMPDTITTIANAAGAAAAGATGAAIAAVAVAPSPPAPPAAGQGDAQ